MSSWWKKSSSKDVKRKEKRKSIIDTIQRKLNRSRGSRRHHSHTISEKGTTFLVPTTSPSPSTHVSRLQSFAERPLAQPLPLPGTHRLSTNRANSGTSVTSKPESTRGSKSSLYFPLPKPGCVFNGGEPTDAEEDIGTASISSGSSIDSDDQCDSHFLSPLASDSENGNRATVHSTVSCALLTCWSWVQIWKQPLCICKGKAVYNIPPPYLRIERSLRAMGGVHKDQPPITIPKNSRVSSKPAPQLCNHQILSNTPKGASLHMPNLQIACSGGLWSAPDSSMSSPSRSPLRTFGSEQVLNSGFCTGKPYPDLASGHCSSPGSGHNSVGGDLTVQIFCPQNRCSPECSPIPSPGMKSPGFSSRIHSSAVSPLHPRAGSATLESPTRRPDDVKQQTHRLPLPPITIPNYCPFSPTYSATTTPSAPRSPSIAENLTSPGSRWKKGQLLGRGTFGHVYLGFNSESGEMCAMKEVTLFSDDAKSRESAQQLGQVDDKLYIYLEYVSGGSIYKLLQQYGQLSEIVIRNYTRQILLGLAYLHAKNTVHRDIKAANILVDPNGRVKLADFGMAKHISGQSCPLSFKGSPYWMAPEVIKNSNGCNLAVDIWSLGSTVFEMATTKPPWSQYEGVAAMFKIGNSKDLPAMPDHLSEDGKDFIRQCLQRNPVHRPSAAQLLLHPFVKKATLGRPILSADPSEAKPDFVNAMRSLAIGPAKHNLALVSEAAGTYLSRSSRTGSGSSEAHTPRNISCPVSPPAGSPLLPPRLLHVTGRLSPSPISSPHTASGSSTPLTGGIGAVPFHQTKQPIFSHEGVNVIQRPQNALNSNGSTAYQEPNCDPLWRILKSTFACPDIVSSNNDALGNHNRRVGQGLPREFYDGKSYLADGVSQQLLNDHVRKFHS
ncbi:Mitogen-activated protein kinase kinase kinase 2 [Glycine soja]|nr:Mitogen-activated protein kinase kinase kinase 2 [Glycine soja]